MIFIKTIACLFHSLLMYYANPILSQPKKKKKQKNGFKKMFSISLILNCLLLIPNNF